MDLIERKMYDFLQANFGKFLSKFLGDLKLVARGNILIDIDKRQIKTGGAYLALVDKSRGKDIFKKHVPIELNLKIQSKYKIGIELKGEFTK